MEVDIFWNDLTEKAQQDIVEIYNQENKTQLTLSEFRDKINWDVHPMFTLILEKENPSKTGALPQGVKKAQQEQLWIN